MKINRIASGLLLTVALAVVSCGTERSDGGKLAKETEAVGLRCRNLIDPEGVDKASLSWRIASDARNVVQTAWQVEIASSKKSLEKGRADVWNSEKQLSDRQLNIVPEGVVFEPGKLYWWRVRVWNAADEVTPWSEPARFSVGPDTAYRWQAEWITSEWGENSPMPYLRKEFDASNSGTKPERAVVYMSGLGCGDLYLNGRLVDETRVLDPAQTNYEQYAFYSTFDVTDLLEKGDNCIGVMLGDGWYNQDKVWSAGMSYGKPMLLLQMEITYKDGSKRIVATDSTWTWAPGPVLSANLYAGESYDANREIAGWASPGTPSGDWKSVRPAEGVIPARLVPQVMEPIRLKQEIAPVAMWQDSAGNWIFDFGVNVAAVPRLTVEQPQAPAFGCAWASGSTTTAARSIIGRPASALPVWYRPTNTFARGPGARHGLRVSRITASATWSFPARRRSRIPRGSGRSSCIPTCPGAAASSVPISRSTVCTRWPYARC